MANRYEIDMCNGPIAGKLFRFALPVMLLGIMNLLFNAADIVVVSRFAQDGNAALAAVGSTSQLITLIVNLLNGLALGTSIVVSGAIGARNNSAIDRIVHTSITVAGIGGVLIGIFGVCFAGTFLSWMDIPESVLPGATLYVRIYFCGLPAMMLSNFGSSILRSVGDTRRPLIFIMISGAANVLLNLFFVIALHLDVAGVAIATVLSQCILAVLVIRCLIVNDGAVRLIPGHLRIHRAELAQIVRVGLPVTLHSSIISFSGLIFQTEINGFGKIAIAGNSAAANIEGFISIAINAFYSAALTFTSQNMGAGKLDRVRRVGILAAGMAAAVGFVAGIGVYVFGEQLIAIYRPGETDVIAAGMLRFSFVTSTFFLNGINEVLVGLLRGMGRTVQAMFISLFCTCIVRIIWLYTVYAAFPAIETLHLFVPFLRVLTFTISLISVIVVYRKLRRQQADTACSET